MEERKKNQNPPTVYKEFLTFSYLNYAFLLHTSSVSSLYKEATDFEKDVDEEKEKDKKKETEKLDGGMIMKNKEKCYM